MKQKRLIPCLLLRGEKLVKTVRFQGGAYIGEPSNAIKIFNEREVDELVIMDIEASRNGKEPNYDLLKRLVSEAFMPVGYGGGVSSVEQARKLVNIGIEKIIVCSSALRRLDIVKSVAASLGRQSTVVCLNVSRTLLGRYRLLTSDGEVFHKDPLAFAKEVVEAGAGEIILSCVERDGKMNGYDLDITRKVAESVNVPVVACCGAGSLQDVREVLVSAKAAAAAAGSLFVYYGRHRAVLINYPSRIELEKLWK